MGQALMPKDLLLARKDDDGNTQTLYDHLHNTAELAAGFEKEVLLRRLPQDCCTIPAKLRMTSNDIC